MFDRVMIYVYDHLTFLWALNVVQRVLLCGCLGRHSRCLACMASNVQIVLDCASKGCS